MRGAVLILLLAASLAVTSAQDSDQCDATLATLRSKLAAVEAKLEAVEASGSSCSQEAAALKSKLAAAEEAVASSSATVKGLEDKLAAADSQSSSCQAGQAEVAAQLAAAKDSLAASERQVSDLTAQLAAAQKEAADLQKAAQGESQSATAAQKEAERVKKDLEAAQGQLTSCAAARSKAEGELRAAADEAARKLKAAESSSKATTSELQALKDEIASVRAQLSDMEATHKAAWLPFWATQATSTAFGSLAPLLQQAKDAWQAQGVPALEAVVAFVKAKLSQINSLLEEHAGESWPKLKSSVSSFATTATQQASSAAATATKTARMWAGQAQEQVLAVWNSEAVAKVRPALVAAYSQVCRQWHQVLGELESLLISLLGKSNNTRPLARKPYVTYMVYGGLLAPVLAVGMPLLGLKRSAPRTAEESSVPKASKSKKKKTAGKAH